MTRKDIKDERDLKNEKDLGFVYPGTSDVATSEARGKNPNSHEFGYKKGLTA